MAAFFVLGVKMPELIDAEKEIRKRVAYLKNASGNGVFNKDFFNAWKR